MAWFFRSLQSDKRGSVLPIAAVAVLLSAALIGSGVDLSRAYRAKNRLQSACDAAVLAGRRAETTNGFDNVAQTQAENFFTANFDDDRQDTHDTSFVPFSDDDGETVRGIAQTKSANLLMPIFGFEEVEIRVECQASMGVGNSDVVMVLDTTGSMNWNMGGGGSSGERMDALQDAMKNFYITLQQATSGTNARIRYGFVPYASSVNIGRLLYDTDPSYIADTWEYPSREAVYRIETTQQFDHWGNPVYSNGSSTDDLSPDWERYGSNFYWNNGDCQSSLPKSGSWANDPTKPTTSNSTYTNSSGQRVTQTTTTQRQTRREYACLKVYNIWYVPYWRNAVRNQNSHQYATQNPVYTTIENRIFDHWVYKQVSYDTSVFKTGSSVTLQLNENGSGQPSNMTSSWNGCVQARSTSNADTFSYSSVSGMQPSEAYDLDIDLVPDADDATKWGPMWPNVTWKRRQKISGKWYLTNSEASSGVWMGNPSDVVCPKEAQLLAEMEQADFNAYANALTPNGGTYLDVGLVWGGRLLSENGIFADNVSEAPGNGGEVSRHLIFMTDGEMAPNIDTLTAYGIEYFDRKTTPDGESYGYVGDGCCHSASDDVARHTSRFLAVCKAIKASGIRLWTIAFTTSSTSDLQTCASEGSAYTASDAEELNEAFQEIAKQVGELRIVR
jgi:hypothetical protein